jgi:hypothetical protein
MQAAHQTQPVSADTATNADATHRRSGRDLDAANKTPLARSCKAEQSRAHLCRPAVGARARRGLAALAEARRRTERVHRPQLARPQHTPVHEHQREARRDGAAERVAAERDARVRRRRQVFEHHRLIAGVERERGAVDTTVDLHAEGRGLERHGVEREVRAPRLERLAALQCGARSCQRAESPWSSCPCCPCHQNMSRQHR